LTADPLTPEVTINFKFKVHQGDPYVAAEWVETFLVDGAIQTWLDEVEDGPDAQIEIEISSVQTTGVSMPRRTDFKVSIVHDYPDALGIVMANVLGQAINSVIENNDYFVEDLWERMQDETTFDPDALAAAVPEDEEYEGPWELDDTDAFKNVNITSVTVSVLGDETC
jgi:hypothetical protein